MHAPEGTGAVNPRDCNLNMAVLVLGTQCIPSLDEASALESFARLGKPLSDLADPDRVLLGRSTVL